jgi:hypothetical protein
MHGDGSESSYGDEDSYNSEYGSEDYLETPTTSPKNILNDDGDIDMLFEDTDVRNDPLSVVFHKSSSNTKKVYESSKKKSNVINRLSFQNQKMMQSVFEASLLGEKSDRKRKRHLSKVDETPNGSRGSS